ncbi:hypothetical protein FJZ39_01010 [Candidatus Saccharibacteria bacterium]|nr:hypothetical protein [Candidatus Saccharibacteria bacterium]
MSQKSRTYARNRNRSSEIFSRKGREKIYERDSMFFLKLIIYIMLGSLWVAFSTPLMFGDFFALTGIPVGLVVGLVLVMYTEKYQYNRKIWYSVLPIVAIISYFLPTGIVL